MLFLPAIPTAAKMEAETAAKIVAGLENGMKIVSLDDAFKLVDSG